MNLQQELENETLFHGGYVSTLNEVKTRLKKLAQNGDENATLKFKNKATGDKVMALIAKEGLKSHFKSYTEYIVYWMND
jgi:hypothetical protein